MAHDDTAGNCIGDVEGMACGGAPGSVPVERDGTLAKGPSLVHQISLLGALERAQYHLADLIEQFDGLPETYQPGSDLWQRYDELRDACRAISDAHYSLIGD